MLRLKRESYGYSACGGKFQITKGVVGWNIWLYNADITHMGTAYYTRLANIRELSEKELYNAVEI